MNGDTRKLLKDVGVAVTEADAEAERLAGTVAQPPASGNKEEVAKPPKDASELCHEVTPARWRSPSGSSPSKAACDNWPGPGRGRKAGNNCLGQRLSCLTDRSLGFAARFVGIQ
jgi:hypothetical protein